jgi:hypothetical protein
MQKSHLLSIVTDFNPRITVDFYRVFVPVLCSSVPDLGNTHAHSSTARHDGSSSIR